MAARNLVRLWLKTGDDKYRSQAEKYASRRLRPPMKENPAGLTTMAEALALYLDSQKK